MKGDFQVSGANAAAPFTLKLHRGDGMVLLGMNWKKGKPPIDFVGFGIEYKEPGGTKFFALKNRLGFPGANDTVDPNKLSTLRSPIQKFRWVHFPRNAELEGEFTYRVTPVFMNSFGELSYGDVQEASIELRRETYPGLLNVTYTRGFVSSQAFVDRYQSNGQTVAMLLPAKADQGLGFIPTHAKAEEALTWMGFEARSAILEALDLAIADKKAKVSVVAYDLNEPGIVTRLEKLRKRVRVIIDDDGAHGKPDSAESQAFERLVASAGEGKVIRQHMGKLQHNKTIIVDGPKTQLVVGGSTNFSWRGFFVQANNALVIRGKKAVKIFTEAFNTYFKNGETGTPFGDSLSASWNEIGLKGIKAKVSFSPHAKSNALLKTIADDIGKNTTSNLLFSLAFLYQTPGAMQNAVLKVAKNKKLFVYGISDKPLDGEGFDLQKPDGNLTTVSPAVLNTDSLPEPFKSEPVGGAGTRMHHKFVVIDFDKSTARVYMGSYNFSDTADNKNGENLFLIQDRRVAVSYMIEAIRLFDHYHFRIAQQDAATAQEKLTLKRPPHNGELPWWSEDYTNARKVRDRELFS